WGNADARRYSHKAATHFEAKFVSACSCSGQYRDRRDEDEELSPKKRRITGQGSSSYKVGCKAKICIKVNAPLSTAAISSSSTDSASLPSTGPSIAVGIDSSAGGSTSHARSTTGDSTFSLPGPPREDSIVTISYYWKHTNHDPGSWIDAAQQRTCREVREWIERQVSEGRSMKEIMRSVRLSLDDLQKVRTSTTAIDASIRVRYQDVYNVIRRLKVEQARKAADGWESCRLWAAELAAEGWSSLFCDSTVLSATAESVWALFLLPPVGKEILAEQSSRVWCLDSTHNTGFGMIKSQKIFLSTIIVRSLATGTGFPAALLITPSETQIPLTHFLVWLGNQVPPPSDIVVDCSTTEQAAINRAFNHLPTPPRILLCQWHVLRAWEDNIKDKIRVLSEYILVITPFSFLVSSSCPSTSLLLHSAAAALPTCLGAAGTRMDSRAHTLARAA
ncbi:hypothetical protein CF336_g8822, partial [Tilletia laevis]